MVYEINRDNVLDLHHYFLCFGKEIPYYFPVTFEHWKDSLFDDCDDDGKPLFSQLKTFVVRRNGRINGFIQFGVTNFTFDHEGKNYDQFYGVIRNLHYDQDAETAYMLLDRATEYFDRMGIEKRYAFFHFFGMRCYAGQGKLHASSFYMEDLLNRYGFIKEHENVYYSKSLINVSPCTSSEIAFSYGNDAHSVSFIRDREKIGGCELFFVPDLKICYLQLIYIEDKYSHQGLGTKCMNKLFDALRRKGILQLDTDTADDNTNAQGYYLKTGFEDKGRMRSYHTI